MQHRQAFLRHVDALGGVALHSLVMTGEGACSLRTEAGQVLSITLDDAAGRLCLRADLGPLPPARRAVLYRCLLAGNLFPPAPDVVLSLDDEARVHATCRIRLQELDTVALSAVVDAVLAAAEQWRRNIQGAGTADADDTLPPCPPLSRA